MMRLSSDCGGFPVHTANLHESSATCSVTPSSGVYKEKYNKLTRNTDIDKHCGSKVSWIQSDRAIWNPHHEALREGFILQVANKLEYLP